MRPARHHVHRAERPSGLDWLFSSDPPTPAPVTGPRLGLLADGTVWVGFSRVTGGKETLLGSKATSVKVSAGQKLNVEGSVTGTNPVALSVRAWVSGATKPGWQQTYNDTSSARITATGAVRAWGYLSSTASGSASVAFSGATAAGVSTHNHRNGRSRDRKAVGFDDRCSGRHLADRAQRQHHGDQGRHGARPDGHPRLRQRAGSERQDHQLDRPRRQGQRHATGLITDYGYPDLVIENVDVKAEYPSVYFDGIKGNNFIARRVHV